MSETRSTSGYSGICSCCFAPIKTDDEIQLRPEDMLFHQRCVEDNPRSHYIVLEHRRAARLKEKEAQCITADQSRTH